MAVLHHQRQSSAVPSYNRIIIEITSLANPEPIRYLLLTYPDGVEHHDLAALVAP